MQVHELILNEERGVSLTALVQSVGGEFGRVVKRPAILILPGGGYAHCSDREAYPVAFAYAKAGYQAFILRYSTGEHKTWPNPLNDYEQAMELIRSKTDEWHVFPDKIAVLGFSAGGHLAGGAATISKNRPNAAILGYAVLAQEVADVCQSGMPVPIDEVDQDTCPCFLFHTRDDQIVPVRDAIEFQRALLENHISFESHIYAYGEHGFSTGEKSIQNGEFCSRVPNWVQDSIAWLTDIFGEFGDGRLEAPACPPRTNADREPHLSVDCTLAHLKRQTGAASEILEPLFQEISLPEHSPLFYYMLLRTILRYRNIPADKIGEIDQALRSIPNQM